MTAGAKRQTARLILAGVVALLVPCEGVLAEQPAGSKGAWNVRKQIPLEEITVQSHRGAGKLAPENTVAAFELGWKLGTVPEADLRTTRDGVIVAFHDASFKRLVKGADADLKSKGIEDLDWADVQQLDVGVWKGDEFAGLRVPCLDDLVRILAEHPERRLYLDIKTIDPSRLASAVGEAGVESQVILASTDYDLIRRWKSLAPAAGTLHWMGGSEKELSERLRRLREEGFEGITQLQIHVRTEETDEGKVLMPSEAFLAATGDELRKHGILYQALPWGRSDAAVYWQLMDLGVASFATDYPDVTMEAIREYYAKTQ